MKQIEIQIDNGIDLIAFYGEGNQFFSYLKTLHPTINIGGRDHRVWLEGETNEVSSAKADIDKVTEYLHSHRTFGSMDQFREFLGEKTPEAEKTYEAIDVLSLDKGGVIRTRHQRQVDLVYMIDSKPLVFATGSAGSGKTFMAVAMAVKYLRNKVIQKIILTRPVVEAGERLGFLPGDVSEKLDPYLQPLYDALRTLLSAEKLAEYQKRFIIEIVPLAFMRGRTLENAFVILDEAQNASKKQMQMFLTRMGPHSKFVITGDPQQIDIPSSQTSGLQDAVVRLSGIQKVGVVRFGQADVVRHPLVREIIRAYE